MDSAAEAVVIVNPTAGRGRAGKEAREIRRLLGPKASGWVWQHTQKRGDGEHLARAAAEAGTPLVVAVGGDGTLHEVVNGVLGTEATVGLIPFGTGNDLARALGLFGDLERACRALTEGRTKRIDVGVIEGRGTDGPRHFLALTGTGFDARTAQTVNAGIRGLSGPLAYVWGAVLTLKDFVPFALTLTLDGGETQRTEAMFVSFANAPTTGGGMLIAPGATVDDGFLDICLVETVSKPALLFQLSQVFSGKHVNHPAVTMLRARSLTVDADPPQPLLIDGEVCGTTPATIKLLAGGVAVQGSGVNKVRYDVVIPAGGTIDAAFRQAIGAEHRALAPVGPEGQACLAAGRPCSARQRGRLKRSLWSRPRLFREAIERRGCLASGGAGRGSEHSGGIGGSRSPSPMAIVCASDLPLLTAESDGRFFWSLPRRRGSLGRFGARRCLQSNVLRCAAVSVCPVVRCRAGDAGRAVSRCIRAIVVRHEALFRRMFQSRKAQWRMAGLLGPRLLWGWATRTLSLRLLTERAEHLLGGPVQSRAGCLAAACLRHRYH